MSKLNATGRAVTSRVLVLAIACVFSLTSFAASSRSPSVDSAPASATENLPGAFAGRLIGSGVITIDDYLAKTGATVLSGSTIATGANGQATIDLNALGQIQLKPNTRVMLTYEPGIVDMKVERAGSVIHSLAPGVKGRLLVPGDGTRLAVLQGQIDVKSDARMRTVSAGESMTFDRAGEATASGEVVIAAEGGDLTAASGNSAPQGSSSGGSNFITPGWIGILAISGAAAAIAIGIAVGDNDDDDDEPPRPSPIVP